MLPRNVELGNDPLDQGGSASGLLTRCGLCYHVIHPVELSVGPEIWWLGSSGTAVLLLNFSTHEEPQALCARWGGAGAQLLCGGMGGGQH